MTNSTINFDKLVEIAKIKAELRARREQMKLMDENIGGRVEEMRQAFAPVRANRKRRRALASIARKAGR